MNLRGRGGFTLALATTSVAAGGALLVAGRPWQTIAVQRPRPLADEVLHVSGRTLQPALTALAIVAVAGAVAVLATKGGARRIVGTLLALTGVTLLILTVPHLRGVSPERARELVRSAGTGVGLAATQSPTVSVQVLWPLLTLGCGLGILAAGVLVTVLGNTWSGLSNRYEAPTVPTVSTVPEAPTALNPGPRAERPRADAALWNSLDRGDDPTVHTEP